jgi:hypothetical protein
VLAQAEACGYIFSFQYATAHAKCLPDTIAPAPLFQRGVSSMSFSMDSQLRNIPLS